MDFKDSDMIFEKFYIKLKFINYFLDKITIYIIEK